MLAMLRLLVIGIVCTMLLIPIAGFSSSIISNQPLLIAVSCGLAYVVIPSYLLHIWPEQRGLWPSKFVSMQDALWKGELLTVEHQVKEIAQLEEFDYEDEARGFHFLVMTEQGETLSLSGRDLYGPVQRRAFPSERVRIFTNRLSGFRYGIEPVGNPIESWPVYDPFISQEKARSMEPLENGRYYKQTIAELVAMYGWQETPPFD